MRGQKRHRNSIGPTSINIEFTNTHNSVLQQTVYALCGATTPSRNARVQKLPGPLPTTLSRIHLQTLLRTRLYYVAEKSDGVRHMMLVDPRNSTAMIIDRVWNTRILHKDLCSALIRVLGNSGCSIIDGEIVQDPNFTVFLVYDVAAINGDSSFGAVRFSERLQKVMKIAAEVKELWNVDNFSASRENEGLVLDIQAKLFVPQREIGRILSKIRVLENGEHEFYDQGRNRRNKNDGLIFTADDDNYLQNDKKNSLLKWKWLEHNTVDFKLIAPLWKRGENELELYCGGYGSSDILIRKQTVSDEIREMLDDAFLESNTSSLVYECKYDRNESCWRILHRRADKNEANFVTTVLSTMETMVDNVTIEEIKSTCEKNRK